MNSPKKQLENLKKKINHLQHDNESKSLPKRNSGGGVRISGRNKLSGRVVGVRHEGLLSQIQIDVNGQIVTSIITRAGADEMQLRVGVQASALIKATEVMIIRG